MRIIVEGDLLLDDKIVLDEICIQLVRTKDESSNVADTTIKDITSWLQIVD